MIGVLCRRMDVFRNEWKGGGGATAPRTADFAENEWALTHSNRWFYENEWGMAPSEEGFLCK